MKLSERLGIKDHTMVLNLIVNKVAANLRMYGSCDDIIQATLTLFQVPQHVPDPASDLRASGVQTVL